MSIISAADLSEQISTDLDGDGKYDKNVVYSYDDEGKFKGVLDLK